MLPGHQSVNKKRSDGYVITNIQVIAFQKRIIDSLYFVGYLGVFVKPKYIMVIKLNIDILEYLFVINKLKNSTMNNSIRWFNGFLI